MKKLYLLAALLLTFFTFTHAQSITSIHYWDFNGTAGAAPNKWPSPQAATSSLLNGTITHNFTTTDNFAGSTLDAAGFSTPDAGASLSVVSNANNGNSMILNVSTVGYQGIQLSYATRGTSTGFTTHTIDYSTDGSNYLNLTTITGRNNTSFSLQTADFSAITAANDNANFKIRITLSGATAAAGNNRFDNFRVTGTLATSNMAMITDSVDGSENPNAAAQFLVQLNNPAPAGGVTLSYRLSGVPKMGEDYTDPQNGTVTVPAGATSTAILLPVINDAVPEPNEYIVCQLLSASNGFNFGTGAHTTTITDDDASTLYAWSFATCNAALSDGFTQFSAQGAELWACTTFGNTGNGVQMNGFANSAAQTNDDWLISPALDLSATNIPLLSFFSRTKFAGPSLKLLVSTDYTGSGNPAAATWVELNGRWPATHSDVWTLSQMINLSAFKQANVYIAFQYLSDGTNGASRWTLDDINIIDALNAPAPLVTANATLVDLQQVNFGSSSTPRSFSFWADDLTSDLTVTAPAGVELSKDGTLFTSVLTYSAAETSNQLKTGWARLTPLSANNSYSGYLNFSSAALNTNKFFVKGNSYPADQTLNVVNWNIEWFGSPSAGQGPVDDNLAQANAKAVMEYLDADVYALAEIVDGTRLQNLVNSLAGGYSYVLGEFCSSGGSLAACASAQKLALVYKTSVLSNVTARPLMNNGVGSTAYDSWSSGRYPFLVSATVNKNGFSKSISFIVLHAKALDDTDSYNRRKAAAAELKDTLDTYFSNKPVIILGDFNDDLDSSIAANVSPRITPYDVLIADSTDADSYRSITLPLSRLSLNSTFENAEMIDHVVISNELAGAYVSTSASLLNDIGAMAGVANFPNTTSDHYPVLTRFLMSGILPSKLLTFEATPQGTSVKIKWTTTREINSKEFVVERSADGRNFIVIGKLAAAGNSNSNRSYQLTDFNPLPGKGFYRLSMTDQDGKNEYSKIVLVHFTKEFYVSISPNPARGLVNIFIENNRHTATVQLTDLNGKMLKQQTVAPGNSQVIRLDITGLARGMYLIKLQGDGYHRTEKILID